jgi:hypothetical protein
MPLSHDNQTPPPGGVRQLQHVCRHGDSWRQKHHCKLDYTPFLLLSDGCTASDFVVIETQVQPNKDAEGTQLKSFVLKDSSCKKGCNELLVHLAAELCVILLGS